MSVAVALADKLDTLVGFWEYDEKPTGSKDPFGLRRAALGVIRVLLEASVDLHLGQAFQSTGKRIADDRSQRASKQAGMGVPGLQRWHVGGPKNLELLSFFADRLKVHLREQGARHDLIDAVFALGEDDLVLIVKRVEALGAFLDTDDGKNLLAGYKRAANILKAEEKKGDVFAGAADAAKLELPEEKALHAALDKAAPAASAALEKEDFAGAMTALAALRGPVDAFFDKVTVNAENPVLRENRLKLLGQIRDALHRVADFGRVEG